MVGKLTPARSVRGSSMEKVEVQRPESTYVFRAFSAFDVARTVVEWLDPEMSAFRSARTVK